MLSRREFLKATSLISMGPVVPGLLARTAHAAASEPDSRVLVVIQLDGGNDGINTVVPFEDDEYGRNRDQLRLKKSELHKIDAHTSLHPNMGAAKKLFDAGELAIVQGVGYPNPDRSHFRSMRIWQTARPDEKQDDGFGWLGRALDSGATRQAPSAASDAIFIGDQDTPVALWGRRSAALSLSRADDLKLELKGASGPPGVVPSADESLDQFVTRHVLSAYASANQFNRQQTKFGGSPEYPDTELASRLKLVSQLLKRGSQARVFYATQTGYDTHSAQLYEHARLLQELSDSIKAFLDDLHASELHDRVVVLVFSEFGRRVKENDSQGTDHGTAAPVFLAGAPIRGGLIGKPPNLSDLDSGDLKTQVDFRQVYATILDHWLGIPSQEILGSTFDQLPLFRTQRS
jgi:uncharacterized protein (DUF1501 family)